MPSIGPQLPPHLQRSRSSSEEETESGRTNTPSIGPQLSSHLLKRQHGSDEGSREGSDHSGSLPASKRQRTVGPSLPPSEPALLGSDGKEDSYDLRRATDTRSPAEEFNNQNKTVHNEAKSPSEAPRRKIGPSLPPAPLEQRPLAPPTRDGEEPSDSDDDYGPALPGVEHKHGVEDRRLEPKTQHWDKADALDHEPKQRERDAWMMMPPQADGLDARMDPTKQRARKFSMKPSGGSKGGMDARWTETAEEKRQRLENEVLGVSSVPSPKAVPKPETARKQLETGSKDTGNSGKKEVSLYDQHKQGAKKEETDDPSKRAFNYEKDMGIGPRMVGKQKRELLNNAKNMGGRFARASHS